MSCPNSSNALLHSTIQSDRSIDKQEKSTERNIAEMKYDNNAFLSISDETTELLDMMNQGNFFSCSKVDKIYS